MSNSFRIFIRGLLACVVLFVLAVHAKTYISPYFAHQGLLLTEKHRFDEALFFLNLSAFLNPQQAKVHYHLGKIYLAKGIPSFAERELKKSLQLKPQMSEALFLLGKIHYQTKHYEPALEELTKAARLEPYNTEIVQLIEEIKKIFVTDQITKAAQLAGENKRIQSKKILQNAVKMTGETFLNLFVLETENLPSKDMQAEIGKLQILSRLPSEEDWQSYQLIGNLYLENLNFKQAIDYYKKSLSQNPNSTSLHHNLAIGFYLNNQVDKAIEEYRIALSFEPDNKSIIYGLARCFESIGLRPQAWHLYRYLFSHAFEMPYIHIDMARLYQKQFSQNEEKKSLQEALDLARRRLLVNEKDPVAKLTFKKAKELLEKLHTEK